MELKIALLPGDGIGPEIVGEAVKVLNSVAAKFGHTFNYTKALVGACAIDATGDPYPAEHACSFVACNVVQTLDVGTHLTFVGEVVDAGNLSGVPPMTYAYYHTTLKGKTPPKASSYVAGIS